MSQANVEHKARFYEDFGAADDEDAEGLDVPIKKDLKAGKPADFRALFSGNNDDHFRIGVKFTRLALPYLSSAYTTCVLILQSTHNLYTPNVVESCPDLILLDAGKA